MFQDEALDIPLERGNLRLPDAAMRPCLADSHPAALRYLTQAPSSPDLDSLNAATQAMAGGLGFTAFGLAGIARPGAPISPRGFFCYGASGWREAYVAAGCQMIDPSIPRILANNGPFTWSSLKTGMRARERDRLFGVAADFGFADGVVVPTLGQRGEISVVVFMTSDRVELDRAGLTLLSACAQTYAASGLSLAGPPPPGDGPLSRRERQCLAWVARGKSDSITADILGLSEKTVRMFVNNARRKLGATSRWHAVMAAWENGWLLDEPADG